MALNEGSDHRHRRRRSSASSVRPHRSSKNLRNVKKAAPSELPKTQPDNIDALRAARLTYLESSKEHKPRKMRYVGETVTRTAVLPVKRTADDARSEVSKRSRSAPRAQRRNSSKPVQAHREDDGEGEFVYGRPAQAASASTKDTAQRPVKIAKTRKTSTASVLRTASEIRGLPRRNTEPMRTRSTTQSRDCDTQAASKTRPASIAASKRNTSRPSIQRSATQQTSTSSALDTQSTTAPNPSRKPASSVFSFLRTPTATPERKITCLTCGDSVHPSHTAKLSCSHRMCHPCLRRIFTLSVTDPAHMPPRCCTTDHIPLRHVDKLFTNTFKTQWNHKFREYTTRNRLYCPSRHCGAWIKPEHIKLDTSLGRKVGKCKSCGTKVCTICNNRSHRSSECPKDPETKRFVEVAKEKGWQRCPSCSAMVELAEGCNHMTCRCTAEFCIVCGCKWKTCDCPWFNYEQVDVHLGNPARYQEELDRRRVQERRDEEIARRMEVLGLDEPPALGAGGGAVPRGGAGGNRQAPNFADQAWAGLAAGDGMDRNILAQAREVLTANYGQAQQVAREWMNGIMANNVNQHGARGVHEQVTLPHPQDQDHGQAEPRRPHGVRRTRRERRAVDAESDPAHNDLPPPAAPPLVATEAPNEPAERRPALQRRTTSATNATTARPARRQSAFVDMFTGRA